MEAGFEAAESAGAVMVEVVAGGLAGETEDVVVGEPVGEPADEFAGGLEDELEDELAGEVGDEEGSEKSGCCRSVGPVVSAGLAEQVATE